MEWLEDSTPVEHPEGTRLNGAGRASGADRKRQRVGERGKMEGERCEYLSQAVPDL